jgi:hypothetical protein
VPRWSIPQWLRRPWIVDSVDPDGRQVICSESWWLSHISARHPEMKGLAHVVAAAVKSPGFINQDTTYPNRRVFYREGAFSSPFHAQLLKIVVVYPTYELGSFPPASIVTAYAVQSPKKGEQTLWPSPEQPELL